MKKKILIFYISQYSGHFQAAKAIKGAFSELEGDFEVEMINAFNYTNPVLGKLLTKTYIEVIKKKPDFWGNIYDNPDVLKKVVKARDMLHKFNSPKMKKLLDRVNPDIVYCTQAFPCGMIADYKSTSGKNVPLVAVLTDHAPHSYWVFNEVDTYIVPSDKTAGALEDKGCSPKKILNYGIPVDGKFKVNHTKGNIIKRHGLSADKPTVLIMGGNQGLGAIESIVKSFLEDEDRECQLLVITGKNKRLYSRIQKQVKGRTDNVKVYSFVQNIEELMEISDLVITKAGGITTAEALAKKLPMLIVCPIPGQETMNTQFLVEEGAAVEVNETAKIYGVVKELFESRGRLEEMKKNAERIAKPDSALKIAELALKEN